MKHMKQIVMIMLAMSLTVGAGYMIKCYLSKNDSDVKIQSFCLGLCGQNKDGKGGGIGIGASDSGPLIIAGPWGNKSNDNDTNEQNVDSDSDEDQVYDEEEEEN